MTTVAYRDGIMAADSKASYGDTFGARVQKVYRSKNGDLVGAAGELADVGPLREWVETRACSLKSIPDLPNSNALWVKPDGSVFAVEKGSAVKIEGSFFAIGSGSDVARGAMAAGASAEAAVGIAVTLDNCTGGDIRTVALDT